ncbi:TIGR00270 family protein [Candidatus Woesearchaeota archaeon]|nr:TIGR00270 family protein [Candidatus Woesearchaeota archaeon]
MQCDMCGKEDYLLRTLIEGTELTVCKACARFGKVLGNYRPEVKQKQQEVKKQKPQVPAIEIILLVREDYAQLIKQKREQLNLTQEEFAKKLNEKHSFLQNIEAGKHMPSIELARKLEKTLGIVLIQEHKELHEGNINQQKSGVMTLGDIIKLKKK